MSSIDKLFSKFKLPRAENKEQNIEKKETPATIRDVSYLDYLAARSGPDDQALEQIIQTDLDVDLSEYSSDARKGFLQFLQSMKGFEGRSFSDLATRSPIYMGLASDIPENQRDQVNFVQAYLHNPEIRSAVVRSCALLNDHPDELSRMVYGRMNANYYGELIGRNLGDEAIVRIAELSDCEKDIEEELAKISTIKSAETSSLAEAKSNIVSRLRGEAVNVIDHVFGEELHRALEYDPEGYGGFWFHLLDSLDSTLASQRVFLACTRLLRQRGELSLENIRNSSLEVMPGGKISEKDAQLICDVQAAQYRDKYPESLKKELQADLADALKSPHSHFYLYRKDDEIITFVRFDELTASSDEAKYMGSFMTNPKFEGGALGQALLETALKKEMEKGAPLYAICDPNLVPFYEKFGFRLLRSYKDDHGVESSDIVLEPESTSLREAA